MNSKKKGMSLLGKQRAAGWTFLAPATIMIAIMSFYPMIRAFIISLQTGAGANMRFADPIFSNYKRILADKVFQQSIANTFLQFRFPYAKVQKREIRANREFGALMIEHQPLRHQKTTSDRPHFFCFHTQHHQERFY